MELSNADWFIIVLSLLTGFFFMLSGMENLHQFYFGFILGFFIYVIVNLQIQIIANQQALENMQNATTYFQSNSILLNNAGFILSLITVFIPVISVILVLNNYISFKTSGGRILSFVFGTFLVFFLISIGSYILANSYAKISFLGDFFTYFSPTSKIINFFFINNYLCGYIIFLLIFGRIFFRLFSSFILYVYGLAKDALRKEE